MSDVKHGGPAFLGTTSQPNERGVYYPVHHQGMDLRDWFAGQALPHIMRGLEDWPEDKSEITAHAELAYMYADAMLAARQKDAPHD